MRVHRPTIAYVERRTAGGQTKAAIIRCLKRDLARAIYHHLKAPPTGAELTQAA